MQTGGRQPTGMRRTGEKEKDECSNLFNHQLLHDDQLYLFLAIDLFFSSISSLLYKIAANLLALIFSVSTRKILVNWRDRRGERTR